MSTTVEDLLVVLRGDAREYERAMGSGIQLLVDMDNSAQKTAKRLEDVSKAWAQPQSAESFLKNEIALREAVMNHQQQIEKDALREKYTREEAEAQAEWERAEEEKRIEKEKLASEQNDMATFQSWRVAERQLELQQNQALDTQLFNLTHSGYERRLRDMEIYYAKQREAHRSNAEALKKIDQLHFLEWSQLERAHGDESRRQLLARRGPLMMPMRQLLPQLGFAAGGQVGMLGMMLSQGNVASMGVMVGVMALVGAMKQLKQHQEEMKKLQEDYNKEVLRSAKEWRGVAEAQTGITELGGVARGWLSSMNDKLADMMTAYRGEQKTGFMVDVGWQEATTEKGQAIYKQMRDLSADKELLEAAITRELDMQRRISYDRMQAEEASLRIRTSVDNPANRRAALEAELQTQERSASVQAEMKIRTLELAHAMEMLQAKRMEAFKPGETVRVEERQKKEMGQAIQDALDNYDSLKRMAAMRREKFDRDERMKVYLEEEDAINARIQLQFEGSARDMELLKQKHARELFEYEQNGRDVSRLLTKQWYEMELLKKTAWESANKGLVDQTKDLELQFRVLIGEIDEATAALWRLQNANPKADRGVIKDLHEMQQKAQLAEWAKGELDRIHPERVMDEYTARLHKAVKAGLVNQMDAAKLWEEKYKELFPEKEKTPLGDTGEFKTFRDRYVNIQNMTGRSRMEELTEQIEKNTRPIKQLPPGMN